jgi:transcriptional regulator with XRE-family HTH domain
MINSEKFAERLKKIMAYYQLTASSFADRIKVPRSSISNLLSGRNKPSLEFVMKVIREFNEVELYWLLNGKGQFPDSQTTTPAVRQKPVSVQQEYPEIKKEENSSSPSKKIERIVIFYTDGTFREYTQ